MAMGSIPITSRFANSTLPELTNEWDMGPRDALHVGSHHGGVSDHIGYKHSELLVASLNASIEGKRGRKL